MGASFLASPEQGLCGTIFIFHFIWCLVGENGNTSHFTLTNTLLQK